MCAHPVSNSILINPSQHNQSKRTVAATYTNFIYLLYIILFYSSEYSRQIFKKQYENRGKSKMKGPLFKRQMPLQFFLDDEKIGSQGISYILTSGNNVKNATYYRQEISH